MLECDRFRLDNERLSPSLSARVYHQRPRQFFPNVDKNQKWERTNEERNDGKLKQWINSLTTILDGQIVTIDGKVMQGSLSAIEPYLYGIVCKSNTPDSFLGSDRI